MPLITNQLLYLLSYVGRGQFLAGFTKFRPTQSRLNPDGGASASGRMRSEKPWNQLCANRSTRSVGALPHTHAVQMVGGVCPCCGAFRVGVHEPKLCGFCARHGHGAA